MRNPKTIKAVPPPVAKKDPAVTAFKEAFRLRLKRLREEADLTQEELCEAIDLPVTNYKHIEGKRASPFPPHKFGKLAVALRRSVHYIMTGREWRGVTEDESKRVA